MDRDYTMQILKDILQVYLPRRMMGINMFGQEQAVTQIKPFLDSNLPMPHILLRGEPGIGKTHFAKWIASQRHETFESLVCPVAIRDIPTYGIILLDEVHRQAKPEELFTMMDDSVTVTFIGATTRPDKLEPAFASRFFLDLHLVPLTDKAAAEMVNSLADVTEGNAILYAHASAGVPRQVERIAEVIKRIGDNPQQVLAACRVTADGITEAQIDYMTVLAKSTRPMGAQQLATLLYTDEATVRLLERYLVQLGLIDLQVNGRALTPLGYAYIKAL
jgi:Holliday junction resolvasome RuvABC ATP-dependent DNA helicase subunit